MKMKVASACLQCRIGKRKCGKSPAGTACPQCTSRGIQCSGLRAITAPTATATANPSRLRLQLQPATHRPTSLEMDRHQLPSREITTELIDLYISYLHDKPHTLFHEPSLRASAAEGTLSPAVLFGIFGLAARSVPRNRPLST